VSDNAKYEHEILMAFVVTTDLEKREAQDWLLSRLRDADAADDSQTNWRGPIGDQSETHVDSYWVAEDDRSNAEAQQGLRSAVFVPEALSQEQASDQLEWYAGG